MNNRRLYIKHALALSTLAALFWISTPASAQALPPQDNDTTRTQLAIFDQFMDSHPEIAEQLRRNPSLVRNEEFVENHPALQQFLQQHPGVREEITENPNGFMQQERRFDRREDAQDRDRDVTRRQLATFDQFMDSHPEIAEQLRRNPSLVKNDEFVKNHPALQQFLQQHPGVREEITENPNGFMQQERRFDRREDAQNRDRDTTRGELANFGQFLGNHSNIAQQLSKNPSLANNEEFMENHPELQQYLQAHPGVREELKENPQAFMASVQQLNNGKPATKTPSLDPKPR